MREIKKWTTNLTAHLFHGTREEREIQKEQILIKDITITTYEIAILEKAALKKVKWNYLMIDEGENETFFLSQI